MAAPVYYHEGYFPPTELNWPDIIASIGATHAAVARYDGLLSAIPNAAVLLSPLTTQEAVLSSRIEGTQATMGEVLEFEAKGGNRSNVATQKEADIWEILNYRKAMRTAESMLRELPLSQRVVRTTHKTLLSGVRGHGKSPGEYRRIPNWIGPHGCSIKEARFVPISAEKLPDAMSQWERFANTKFSDSLIQLAILHAEFEALHPFLDGNGRLGRILIPLFMYQTGMIHRPMFYISAFLEANRDIYYDQLLAVSRDKNWTGWCLFFMTAVQHQAEENLKKANAILELYNRMKKHFAEMTHSQYSIHALDWVFERPIFKSSDFVRSSQIPIPTAKRILNVLREGNILKVVEEGKGRKSSVLVYSELLNIAEGHNAF